MDTFSREKRSEIMRKVRSSDTAPERLVRRLLYMSGYRFRLMNQKLPGKPDIVLPKYRTVILVHGCFWHRHKECREAAMPESNVKYWSAKFERNKMRDQRIMRELRRLGWRVFVVWECQTKNPPRLLRRLRGILVANPAYLLAKHEAASIAAEAHSHYKSKSIATTS